MERLKPTGEPSVWRSRTAPYRSGWPAGERTRRRNPHNYEGAEVDSLLPRDHGQMLGSGLRVRYSPRVMKVNDHNNRVILDPIERHGASRAKTQAGSDANRGG